MFMVDGSKVLFSCTITISSPMSSDGPCQWGTALDIGIKKSALISRTSSDFMQVKRPDSACDRGILRHVDRKP